MTSTPSSWETLRLTAKLKPDEVEELRDQLRPILVTSDETEEDDLNLFLEFATTMISNKKSVAEAVKELVEMEMDLCPESASVQIGQALQTFIEQKIADGSDAAVSPNLDTSEPVKDTSTDDKDNDVTKDSKPQVTSFESTKGNALTMSGALGASRGKKADPQAAPNNKNKQPVGNKQRDRKGGDNAKNNNSSRNSNNNNNNNRKGRHEKKDSRDIRGEAFDRLSQRKDGGGRGRSDRRQTNDRRDGRGRRNDNHNRRDDRHRDDGRGPPRRRPRDEQDEDQPHNDGFQHSPGRGGRGGRFGRGGRGDFDRENKRQRTSENYHQDNYHEGGRGGGGYNDQPHDYDPNYQAQGYGGGRGRFGGRSFRGGRGRFHRGGRANQENYTYTRGGDQRQPPPAENQEGGAVDADTAEAAAVNPSPLVQNWRGGFRGGRGGRGFYRGGRSAGRGWNGGRPDVKSMLASKTWVRKKDVDSGDGGGAGNKDNASTPAPAEG